MCRCHRASLSGQLRADVLSRVVRWPWSAEMEWCCRRPCCRRGLVGFDVWCCEFPDRATFWLGLVFPITRKVTDFRLQFCDCSVVVVVIAASVARVKGRTLFQNERAI